MLVILVNYAFKYKPFFGFNFYKIENFVVFRRPRAEKQIEMKDFYFDTTDEQMLTLYISVTLGHTNLKCQNIFKMERGRLLWRLFEEL